MTTFTKSYLEAVAAIIAEARRRELDGDAMAQYIRDQLALVFQQTNPRFDVDKFMRACEVQL